MSDAIARVEASWDALIEAIRGIPEERMSEPARDDEWSVKDILAHVAWWDGRAIGTVERSLSHEPEPDVSGETLDSINEGVYKERADWTVAQVLDELHGTHERLLAALRHHPNIDPDLIEGDTFEHYEEHTADILAWRESKGN